MVKKLTVGLTCFALLACLLFVNVYAGPTITSNTTGSFDGYDYEYWKDNGTGTMTLNGGGTFSCSWNNINNILFRTGKRLGSTKAWQDYGNITINYACDYKPNGNSYMSVYGWTKEPLVEYYIIESYGTWKPPGNGIPMKGTISVDGGTYEVYQNSRTGPSIVGDTTFQQYWSIRTSKRTSGVITVNEHFKQWEAKGMRMGKMHEVTMVVEGYQSSGQANMTKMELTMGGSTNPTTPPVQTNVPATNPPTGSVSDEPLRVLAEKIRAKGHEFYVGCAVPGNFSSSDQNIVKTEFDIVTCENNMKIGTISPNRNQYNYGAADSLVNFARTNNMMVHGHAFVWHKYNPGWVDGTKSMMETYINDVGTYYKGKIYAWDVVNEAIHRDGSVRINAIGSNGQDGASVFGQKQGKKYIEDAFIAARKADPNAKLVYNDYDLIMRDAKFEGVFELVKDLKERNIPIDGVGFQVHLGSDFTEANAKNFAQKMQRLADIGLESYVTEMDVGCSDTSQAGLEKQAQTYGWIAKACVEQPYCRAFQVWGIRDSQSWRINPDAPEDRAIAPLIFNDNGQKKPAYYAIQKAFADALNSTPSQPTGGVISGVGDINDDGNVDSIDYSILKRHILSVSILSGEALVRADVNADGNADSTDYAMIKKYILGLISDFGKGTNTNATPTPTRYIAVATPTPTRHIVATPTNPITGGKVVALTFDDGPSSQTTLVLDKLKKYNAKATFMVIGNKISSADSVMRRIVSEGHEIGNHSWNHQSMNGMSASQLTKEIDQCNSAIQQYTGSTPKFFRAPNLAVGGSMASTIKLPFVVGVIAQDWNGGSATTAQARANIVINGVRDGSIVLMHCTQPGNHPTPEALDIIIPNLQQQGYSFVTLSELFRTKGKTPQSGVSYDGAF
jgi:endo-1,4-beta-xylanase